MNFTIIGHAEHYRDDARWLSYGPYVKEMNLWTENFETITVVAPVSEASPSAIDLAYEHAELKLVKIPAISLVGWKQKLRTLRYIPLLMWRIFKAMRAADHIHLRCPGNIGLLACLVQVLFPSKKKTAKYAGNWDPQAIQPWSYRFQKWILGNSFLTKNMKVLVYGDWPNQGRNIHSFFTATYRDSDIPAIESHSFQKPFSIVFVGSLSPGKRPLYGVKLVHALSNKGFEIRLDIYGDGEERAALESYILEHSLSSFVQLHGNQTAKTVEKAYKSAQFLMLPSQSEGWPKVVAEAMFWGVIPVATPISCVPWMLNYGNRGILLTMNFEEDVIAFAKAIDNPTALVDMANKGQQWSHKYTLDTFEKAIKALI